LKSHRGSGDFFVSARFGLIFIAEMVIQYQDGLGTERLRTRFVTPEDALIWTEYCSDPVATEFTAIPEMSAAEMARYVIDLTIKRYADGRMGLQAMIDKQTGAFVGQCGLLIQEVDGKSETEIGYHFLRRHWGRGYATEAARMFRDHAFESFKLDSVISMIHPDNIASQKVALRNGLRHTENTYFKSAIHPALSKEYCVYRITRKEWEGLRRGA